MKIKIENITKNFKNTCVLNDISYEFDPGKIYGLVGRNGTGKSVLLKIICGIYTPDSGRVLFDDKEIDLEKEYAPSTRALIERPCFLPDISGFENLRLLANIQNLIGDEEILESIEKVNLTADKDKKYSKYSLGMKQKLGIAQVIMESPDLEILDEPFNAIDDESLTQIRNVILEEKKKGKIIIIATHLKEDIDNLCDVVLKMNNGKITVEK